MRPINLTSKKNPFFGPFTLTLLSLSIAVAGQYYLYFKDKIAPGVILLLIASAVFILADLFNRDTDSILFKFSFPSASPQAAEKTVQPRLKPGWRLAVEIILFAAVLFTAVFFRFYKLNDIPPGMFRDEAAFAQDAFDIMRGEKTYKTNSSTPVYLLTLVDNPAMSAYATAAWYRFFGTQIVDSRASMAFLGVLSAIGIYFLIRMLFGAPIAFAGGLYYSFFYYSVVFNRIVFHAGIAPLYMILALYFLFHSFRRPSFASFALFGLAFGMNIHAYHSGKATIVVFLFILAMIFFYNKKFLLANRSKIGAGLLVAFLFYLPLLAYSITQKGSGGKSESQYIFNKSQTEILMRSALDKKISLAQEKKINLENPSLTAAEKITVYAKEYWRVFTAGFLMYNLDGGQKWATFNSFNIPYAGFFTGIFIFIGFWYFLYRALRGSFIAAACFISFVAYIHGGIIFCCAPMGSKSILAMPFAVIFFSGYFERAWSHLKAQFAIKGRVVFLILFALITAYELRDNYKKYFVTYGKDENKWLQMESWRKQSAEILLSTIKEGAKKGEKWMGVLTYDLTQAELPLVFYGFKGDYYVPFAFGKTLPAPKGTGYNYIYFFMAFNEYGPMLTALREFYPRGEYIPVYEGGQTHTATIFAYKVRNEDVEQFNPAIIKKGLRLNVYNEADNKLVLTRIDPVIYNDELYDGNKGAPYRAEWSGTITINKDGEYMFDPNGSRHVPYRLFIDNKKIVENVPEKRQGDTYGKISLSTGKHKIKVVLNGFGTLWFRLQWKIPGTEKIELVPADVLLPE